MNGSRFGVAYGVAAYGLWGLVPLFWARLEQAGEIEILAHRIAWSLVFVAAVLAVSRGFTRLRQLGGRAYVLLAGAAVVVSVNWGMYIWAVVNGHVVEASLGYFINPLVTVLIGVVVLAERLRPTQWAAIGIAALAVVVLTVDYGRPPWIALVLAFSFATYGLIKKKANIGPVHSLAVETAILALPAVGFLVALDLAGQGAFGRAGVGTSVLLAAAGLVTAVPLLFFGAAAIRIPLTTLGLLQYLTPITQFALGVLVFREAVPPVRLVGFSLVWLALAILTAEMLAHRRRTLRAAAADAAVQPATATS